MPLRPSLVEVIPSFMQPWSERSGSSAWEIINASKLRAYSRASRMTEAFLTGTPSSEKATAPALSRSKNSVSPWPFWPVVTAATGRTWQLPASLALSRINRVMPSLSFGGEVLGMQATLVKPPAAAALVPVSMVSLYSWPGSLR